MSITPVTCGDIQSSPIHSAYNYNKKIENCCYRLSIVHGRS